MILDYNFDKIKADAIQRAEDYGNEKERMGKTFHLFPRIWKSIGEVASTGDYDAYREKITEQEESNPTTIRHLTSLKTSDASIPSEEVSLSSENRNCRSS